MSLRHDLNVPMRVAVIQLNCHQAAIIGGQDYLGEPIIDRKPLPLDHLIGAGLWQLQHNKNECKGAYLEWHRARVKSVLKYLETLPAISSPWNQSDDTSFQLPRPFLLVVFPEYSIPFELLKDVRDWAIAYMADETHPAVVVFAGTHSLPVRTTENLAIYEELGFLREEVEYAYNALLPSRSVLPMFYYDYTKQDPRYQIRSKLKLKRILSPFELTNMGKHEYEPEKLLTKSDLLEVPVQFGSAARNSERKLSHPLQMTFLPLICSEALQTTHVTHVSCDVAVIPSYNESPLAFDNVIDHVARLQRLVVFCNDGRYGGSRFAMPPSHRGEGWWLGHPNRGRLPTGDAVIIADVAPMDLAERTAVNNPVERCQLHRLSAIVPDNIANDGFVVAMCIKRLRQLECGIDKVPGEVDISLRHSVLTECLELRDPTPLQRTKLGRLLTLRDIDSRMWALHGDDIVFSSGDGNSSSRATVDLEGLEARLLRDCLRSIQTAQQVERLSLTQHEAIATVIEICNAEGRISRRREASRGDTSPITASAGKFLKLLATRCHDDAQQILATGVAEIVERYQAASAWLFVFSPMRCLATQLEEYAVKKPLECVVAHNASDESLRSLSIQPDEMWDSMAAACARCGDIVLYPSIIQRYGTSQYKAFLPVKKSSRSAVAVPVLVGPTCIGEDRSTLAGVLVLESSEPYAFSRADACELMADARELASPLLYIQLRRRHVKGDFVWHPETVNWSLSNALNAMCYSVASAGTGVESNLGYGLTIWYSDIQFREAYALGAVRFDADYISLRTLQTFDFAGEQILSNDDQENVNREVLPRSFTGRVACSPPGTVICQNWRDIDVFVRHGKATRSEVDWVFATNFSGGDVFHPTRTRVPKNYRESDLQQNLGVISWYTYEGTTNSLARFLGPPQLRQFARLVEQLIATNRDVFSRLAVANLDSRLRTLGITGENSFNIVRDFLMEILDADGCSIFAYEDGSRPSLRCVTSSGLNLNSKEMLRQNAVYFDIEENSPHRTCAVFANAINSAKRGRRFEGCRANRRKEPVRSRRPTKRFLESFTLTDLEHRRTIFQVVWSPKGALPNGEKTHPIGIVRLVRSVRKPPFTEFDADILKLLAETIQDAFLMRLRTLEHASHPSIKRRLGEAVASYEMAINKEPPDDGVAFVDSSEKPADGRKQSLFSAGCRLIVRPLQYQQWTRRRIEGILQDLFFTFDSHRPVLAMFRTITRHGADGAGIRVHAVHGHSFLELTEAALTGLREVEGGIGWNCAQRRTCIEFSREGHSGFTESFPECQSMTARGLCMPLVLPFAESPMLGVLSIEVADDKPFEDHHLAFAFAAANQISSTALDQTLAASSTSGVDRFDDASIAVEFLKELEQFRVMQEKVGDEIQEVRWEFAANVNFVGHTEKDHDELRMQKIEAHLDQFGSSPLSLLPRFVTRSTPRTVNDPRSDLDTRFFGRVLPELECELAALADLDATIDFDKGLFRLPLWIAGARCGTLIGIRAAGHLDSSESDASLVDSLNARMICQLICKIFWQWSVFSRRWCVLAGGNFGWGMHFVGKQAVDKRCSEWEMKAVFGEEWLKRVGEKQA